MTPGESHGAAEKLPAAVRRHVSRPGDRPLGTAILASSPLASWRETPLILPQFVTSYQSPFLLSKSHNHLLAAPPHCRHFGVQREMASKVIKFIVLFLITHSVYLKKKERKEKHHIDKSGWDDTFP